MAAPIEHRAEWTRIPNELPKDFPLEPIITSVPPKDHNVDTAVEFSSMTCDALSDTAESSVSCEACDTEQHFDRATSDDFSITCDVLSLSTDGTRSRTSCLETIRATGDRIKRRVMEACSCGGEEFRSFRRIRLIAKALQQERLQIVAVTGHIGYLDDGEEWYDQFKKFLKNGTLEPIVLIFHCYGGNAKAGIAYAKAVRAARLSGRKIIGLIVGECNSVATAIFSQCQQRVMTHDSSMLYHLVSLDQKANQLQIPLAQVEVTKADKDILTLLQDGFGRKVFARDHFGNYTKDMVYSSGECKDLLLIDSVVQAYSRDDVMDICRGLARIDGTGGTAGPKPIVPPPP